MLCPLSYVGTCVSKITLRNELLGKVFMPCCKLESMKLRKTTQGKYFVLLPEDLIRVIRWKEGDEIEAVVGSEASARKEDLILRRK